MITGFEAGMRNHRVTVLNKVLTSERTFGEKTGYRRDGSLWSSYEFSKGTRALREGALDAYDSVIFRMNFSGNVAKKITRESLIEMHGKIYQIQGLNEDYRDNKILSGKPLSNGTIYSAKCPYDAPVEEPKPNSVTLTEN